LRKPENGGWRNGGDPMPTDYRKIGNEILDKLEVDATRLGEALLTLNEVVRDRLEGDAWDEVSTYCESARKLCDEMWSNVIAPTHVEGIFYAYEGISHLYQAENAKEEKNPFEERAELAKAVDCLEKSQQSFRFEYRDWWNEVVLCLNLGRLYRSQNKLHEALLAFQGIWDISGFRGLSNEKKRGIEKIVSAEVEKTRMLFSDQRILAPYAPKKLPPPTQQKATSFKIPIIDEIADGRAQVFLSYAREDAEKVENLYQELSDAGFKPWMDKKDILPGERWKSSIQEAIRCSDFFLACLSANSVNKRGFIQKEIKDALDIWQEKLDSDIYLIPARLEDCEVPESLRDVQWVNLFEEDGWTRLVKAIQVGMERRRK
jgi:hypothetical protein